MRTFVLCWGLLGLAGAQVPTVTVHVVQTETSLIVKSRSGPGGMRFQCPARLMTPISPAQNRSLNLMWPAAGAVLLHPASGQWKIFSKASVEPQPLAEGQVRLSCKNSALLLEKGKGVKIINEEP